MAPVDGSNYSLVSRKVLRKKRSSPRGFTILNLSTIRKCELSLSARC